MTDEHHPYCLDRRLAAALAFFPLAIALGVQAPFLIQVRDWLTQFDPWNSATSQACRWAIAAVAFLVSGRMFHKQWHYYFGGSGRKDGLWFKTLGVHTDMELSVDVLLCLGGGSLLFCAVVLPYYWLLAFGIYCCLGIWRCYITFRRPAFAAAWARRTEDELPVRSTLFGTYPNDHVEGNNFQDRLRTMSQSVEAVHVGGTGQETPASAILAGWISTFRWHAIYGLVAFLVSTILVWRVGTSVTSCCVTAALIFGIAALFWRPRFTRIPSAITETSHVSPAAQGRFVTHCGVWWKLYDDRGYIEDFPYCPCCEPPKKLVQTDWYPDEVYRCPSKGTELKLYDGIPWKRKEILECLYGSYYKSPGEELKILLLRRLRVLRDLHPDKEEGELVDLLWWEAPLSSLPDADQRTLRARFPEFRKLLSFLHRNFDEYADYLLPEQKPNAEERRQGRPRHR